MSFTDDNEPVSVTMETQSGRGASVKKDAEEADYKGKERTKMNNNEEVSLLSMYRGLTR